MTIYERRDLKEAQADLAAWLKRWERRYPRLTDWAEENVGETLTFYGLPRQHHKHLKSMNLLERRRHHEVPTGIDHVFATLSSEGPTDLIPTDHFSACGEG